MNNLGKIRAACHMTQEELARRVGCSRLSIFRWERALSLPTGDNLLKLATALNTTPNDLLGVESEGGK